MPSLKMEDYLKTFHHIQGDNLDSIASSEIAPFGMISIESDEQETPISLLETVASHIRVRTETTVRQRSMTENTGEVV